MYFQEVCALILKIGCHDMWKWTHETLKVTPPFFPGRVRPKTCSASYPQCLGIVRIVHSLADFTEVSIEPYSHQSLQKKSHQITTFKHDYSSCKVWKINHFHWVNWHLIKSVVLIIHLKQKYVHTLQKHQDIINRVYICHKTISISWEMYMKKEDNEQCSLSSLLKVLHVQIKKEH
jgi:hypothetical protein